jgi:uncharacterized protein YqhQ
MSQTKPYIGGQAVLEGVMLRAPNCLAIAVRRPDGSIAIKEEPFERHWALKAPWTWPGFRGVATLVESFSIGARALRFSAEQQMTAEERASSKDDGSLATMLSLVLAVGLFIALPQGLATGLFRLLGVTLGPQDALFHLVTGGFKLVVLTTYLALVSRVPEMRRVFQYHGAEHKTIYAYEEGLEITVENVQSQSTLHPRCGTTFLIVVVLVSVVLGSIVTPLVLPSAAGLLGQAQTLALRIALLPLVAAISYELQRLSAKYCTTGPLRVLLWPGFLFQKITTREPSDDQVEIAIAAMKAAIWRENAGKSAQTISEPRVFASFARVQETFVEAS